MTPLTIAATSAPFGRDLEECFTRIATLIEEARAAGVGLLVLPEACLGGYVETLHGDAEWPPAFTVDGPEVQRVADLAGDMVVCFGMAEVTAGEDDTMVHNTAVCVSGGEVLGVHRKVHLPLDEDRITRPGDELAAFDTPVGRIGMLICYDKAFPEASRTLALQGAQILCFLSAWPCSATNAAPRLEDDRQYRRSELWDRARAAENSLIVASANQSGTFGALRFIGSARVIGPGGDPLAVTSTGEGLAIATVEDVDAALTRARRALSPIRDLRPDVYATPAPLAAA
ncbi:N-carbamoyl-D-amino acid hydrolase [Paraconexibacter sp. AEG42_29]|uniref:N-carbamoyl-D-amino acid hydrolase n=1 Tax=Paraconexibacter sp. AEG42_29 TaxID=2997339 RepID=A0AAU7AT30_9ACTN